MKSSSNGNVCRKAGGSDERGTMVGSLEELVQELLIVPGGSGGRHRGRTFGVVRGRGDGFAWRHVLLQEAQGRCGQLKTREIQLGHVALVEVQGKGSAVGRRRRERAATTHLLSGDRSETTPDFVSRRPVFEALGLRVPSSSAPNTRPVYLAEGRTMKRMYSSKETRPSSSCRTSSRF